MRDEPIKIAIAGVVLTILLYWAFTKGGPTTEWVAIIVPLMSMALFADTAKEKRDRSKKNMVHDKNEPVRREREKDMGGPTVRRIINLGDRIHIPKIRYGQGPRRFNQVRTGPYRLSI